MYSECTLSSMTFVIRVILHKKSKKAKQGPREKRLEEITKWTELYTVLTKLHNVSR